DETRLKELLEAIRDGYLPVDEGLERLRHLPYEDLGFASLDHHRALRKGFPEVVLGEGKTPEQVAAIAERLVASGDRLLVTRAGIEMYRAIKERLPDAVYHAPARAVTLDRSKEPPRPSVVAGLVSAPVIAVPTSIGYGASFRGLAPLLAMLNACAAGVAVVNIDNGFGAGYLAAVINRQSWSTTEG